MAVFRPDHELLTRQVESLMEQSLQEWSCLVGLDGRDPETRALLVELTSGDPRFRILEYETNVGHYRNFERLSAAVPAESAWVAYCDQDDYWYPHKLEHLAGRLARNPGATGAVGSAILVDRDGNGLGEARRKPGPWTQLLLKNEVTGSFALFRPDVLDLALPFPEDTRAAVHDHWLGVCAATLGHLDFSSEPLQDYVQHDRNAIGEARTSTVRSHTLAARARGGMRHYLRELSREQWGWRVAMARVLLDRVGTLDRSDRRFLGQVARGHLGPGLCRHLLRDLVHRRIPARTAVGLAVAALAWRRASDNP